MKQAALILLSLSVVTCAGPSMPPARVGVLEIGLLAADPGTLEEAIQVREAAAIANTYQSLEAMGIVSVADWQRSTTQFAGILSNDPLSREQMQARVLANEAYAMPTAVPTAAVAERQQQTAGNWSSTLRAEIPALSDS